METAFREIDMPAVKVCEKNRFSKFVRTREDPAFSILEDWKRWFLMRGIRSKIACTDSGWALYRAGLVEEENPCPENE